MRLAISRLVKITKRNRWYAIRRASSQCAAAKSKAIVQNKSSSFLVEGFVPQKKINGFTVEKVQEVPELCLTAVFLTHDVTRAQYLHIAREDNCNAFNVGFRTTPMDSTGVPHILEHTVLCGSQLYPVRDPFFKMLNRSMSTFMNAMTGPDYTMYPFATQNSKDFENLLGVYMDAVFNPCLRKLDFCQEGWRLEHADANDPNSPIIFKGVVFNEMKGLFANSESLFYRKQQNLLLPSHTYANESGGDPISIPDLTWEQLRQFHATHYHPSNARFYTYGNFPLERNLQLINQRLEKYRSIEVDTSVPNEKRWKDPKEAQIHCRPDPLIPNPEKNTTVAVTYLLTDITDVHEIVTLQILSELLVSGPNSPFYKSMLEPQIGSNYSPGAGFNGHTKEAMFSVGLQGVNPKDVEKVKRIVEKTFDDVIKTGFPVERIEAILHTIELSMKHVTTNFGVNLAMGLMPVWNHDGDVVLALQINDHIEKFRQNLKENPTYLQDKVHQYFKNNKHKLTLAMSPDDKFESQLENIENQKLENKLKGLNDTEKQELYEQGLNLVAKQNEIEDISCLPTLKLADIPLTMPFTDTRTVDLRGVTVQTCVQPTNGVTYFRGILSTTFLPDRLKPYLPLFCNVVTRLGAGDMDYKQLSQRIELKTGGMSVSPHVAESPLQLNSFEEGLVIGSHCLDKNVDDMFYLWGQLMNAVNFNDLDRLSTLIKMAASDLASSISDTGHSYAVSTASSGLSLSAAIKERYSGITMVELMRKLAANDNYDDVMEKLRDIASHVFVKNGSRFSVNCTEDFLSDSLSSLERFVDRVQSKNLHKDTSTTLESTVMPQKTHYILPFPVNYVSKCYPGVPYAHSDFASLRVLAQLMKSKYLHREIREKGGAYGSGSTHGGNGIFSFFSYRDPNNIRTLDTFDAAVKWAVGAEYTDQDLDEAKLSVFQAVDYPISPGGRGSRVFLSGITDQMVQKHRENVFAVQKNNLTKAAEKYLSDSSTAGLCILGPSCESIKEESGWKIRTDYS